MTDRELMRRAANALLGLSLSVHTEAIPVARAEAAELAAELRARCIELGCKAGPAADRRWACSVIEQHMAAASEPLSAGYLANHVYSEGIAESKLTSLDVATTITLAALDDLAMSGKARVVSTGDRETRSTWVLT